MRRCIYIPTTEWNLEIKVSSWIWSKTSLPTYPTTSEFEKNWQESSLSFKSLDLSQIRDGVWKKMQHNFSLIFVITLQITYWKRIWEKSAKIVIFLQILGFSQIRDSDRKKLQHNFSLIFIIYTSNILQEANLREIAENRHFPSNPWIRPNSGQRLEENAAQFQLYTPYPYFKKSTGNEFKRNRRKSSFSFKSLESAKFGGVG